MEFTLYCQWCGTQFRTHKMTARYCCQRCSKLAYKARKKTEKIKAFDASKVKNQTIENKPFLSPTEVGTLLGLSRATVYRHLALGRIKCVRIGCRTRIRRIDIEKVFDKAIVCRKREKDDRPTELYYSTKEILEKFGIEKKTLYRRCRMYGIEKIADGNRTLYDRALIDKYFDDLIEDVDLDRYYTMAEVMKRYGMTRSAVTTFVMRNAIPRIKKHHDVYYSRAHFDAARQKMGGFNPEYYSYAEIKDSYGFNRDQIRYYVNKYQIPHKKQGSFTLVLRSGFDFVMKQHMGGNAVKREL